MPYSTISAAKVGNFPMSADGAPLTLAQINKLASIYDATGSMAIAWSQWKKLYKKEGNRWIKKEVDMAEQMKVGEYNVTENENGSYNILKVPIFATIKRDDREYDEEWLEASVANFNVDKSKNGYLPPVVIGHNEGTGEEKESVGLVDNLLRKGKQLYADLTQIAKETFEKIKAGAFPSRSAETWHKGKQLTALALLGGSTPAHKFKPIHVFKNAPEEDVLDWHSSGIDEEWQSNITDGFIDTVQQDTEKETEMTENKKPTDLFTEEQRVALDAIVSEKVRVAQKDSLEKIEALEQEKKESADKFAQVQKEKDEANAKLAAKEKADREISVDTFMAKLRAGTERYGVNEAYLKESGIESLARSLAHDEKKDKFTADTETTKLETFQSVIAKAVELAANGTLIVPKGENAPGESSKGLNSDDQFVENESAQIDKEIEKLATERKIDLYNDPGGQHYWTLLTEVTSKRSRPAENRPPTPRM